MSGFTGIYGPVNQETEQIIAQMSARITHRG